MAALDQTIVATSLPAIASEFKALNKISWVGTAYLLTIVSLITCTLILLLSIPTLKKISLHILDVFPMENFQIFSVENQHSYLQLPCSK